MSYRIWLKENYQLQFSKQSLTHLKTISVLFRVKSQHRYIMHKWNTINFIPKFFVRSEQNIYKKWKLLKT